MIVPMLARPVTDLPVGPGLVYEPKWDGFRAIAERAGSRVLLHSRSGRRLDTRFPEIAAALRAGLPGGTTADGEIVRWSDGGLDFDALQRRNRATVAHAHRLAESEPCHYVVFDLLRSAGTDLVRRKLADRRLRLEELLDGVGQPSPLMLGWQTDDPDTAWEWFEGLTAVGVEGLVVKDARRSYRPGRREWSKFKHTTTTEAIVGGVIGRLDRARALILGRRDPGTGVLRVAGRTAELTDRQSAPLSELLRAAGADHPWPRRLARTWGSHEPDQDEFQRVEPELVVEIVPDVATGAGKWRHVVRYVRARPDLRPSDVPTGLDLET